MVDIIDEYRSFVDRSGVSRQLGITDQQLFIGVANSEEDFVHCVMTQHGFCFRRQAQFGAQPDSLNISRNIQCCIIQEWS